MNGRSRERSAYNDDRAVMEVGRVTVEGLGARLRCGRVVVGVKGKGRWVLLNKRARSCPVLAGAAAASRDKRPETMERQAELRVCEREMSFFKLGLKRELKSAQKYKEK